MDKAGIVYLSAAELGRLIRSKEVSPVEATEAYLERIGALDFKFNAYLTLCGEAALEEAKAAEQEIASGRYRGPLHGVPVSVKDQLWTKGLRTTVGSRILEEFHPSEDATAVARLKDAGAILLGKTNQPEFALIGSVHRYSPPRNPWDLDMSAGGSSSGAGAAVASFLCATSLGEDTGGSIRRPASFCGVVGLRPSWGLVSRHGLAQGSWSMDTVGPISRTVEDAALTLSAIAGHDPRDRYSWKGPVQDYLGALEQGVKGMRVGVVKELLYSDVAEAEVRRAVEKALEVLKGLGTTVEEVSIPLTAVGSGISATLLAIESAATNSRWIRERGDEYGHSLRIGIMAGSLAPASAYYKAQRVRSMVRQEVLGALERYDVLASPTMGIAGERIQDYGPVTSKEAASRLPYSLAGAFSLAGGPAMSVPCGFSGQGLPIGLQLAGRPGGEAEVLRVGHAYEQATEWHGMRPPHA